MSQNDPPPPYNPDRYPPQEKSGIPPPTGYAPPAGSYIPPQGPPPQGPPPPVGGYPAPPSQWSHPSPAAGSYPPPPGGMGYPSQPPPGYGQPVYPAYPPGNPGTQQSQTVIVSQPTSICTTTVVGGFRDAPSQTVCPKCQAQIVTSTHYESGTFTILLCAIICLVGCDLGCCLIPFCVDGCKDVVHRCPNCQQQISRWNRM